VPYFNNKSNFLKVGSEEEAWFIATFLNAPACQRLIGRIAMSTTISPRKLAAIPIPRFDPSNTSHQRLAELGPASTAPEDWETHTPEINALVLALGADVLSTQTPVA
jgi:hypothetical protein